MILDIEIGVALGAPKAIASTPCARLLAALVDDAEMALRARARDIRASRIARAGTRVARMRAAAG